MISDLRSTSFFSGRSSKDVGIKKVKELLESCVLGTDLVLGYGTMENIIGGGMGGPLGPNPNSSKTCEKNI